MEPGDVITCDACETQSTREAAFVAKWQVVGQRWYACSTVCLNLVLKKHTETMDRVRTIHLPNEFILAVAKDDNQRSDGLSAFIRIVNVLDRISSSDRQRVVGAVAEFYGLGEKR